MDDMLRKYGLMLIFLLVALLATSCLSTRRPANPTAGISSRHRVTSKSTIYSIQAKSTPAEKSFIIRNPNRRYLGQENRARR